MARFSELLTAYTIDEMTAYLTQALEDAGLPVSSWQSGSVPVVLRDALAVQMQRYADDRAFIADSFLLETSEGDVLDLVGINDTQLTRIEAEYAQLTITLLDTGSAGPYTITAGSIWIVSPAGYRYNCTTGGTLELNGDLALTFRAEIKGADYNAVSAGTTWTMLTPLAGVTVQNGGDFLVYGRDIESDELYRDRCRNRWASNSYGMTEDGWKYWARASSEEITRAKTVSNPDGVSGRTKLIVAGTAGAIEDEDLLAEVDEILQLKKPSGTTMELVSATNRTIELSGVIYVEAAYSDAVQTQVPTDLLTHQQLLEIGEDVYLSQIICICQDIDGVRNVVLDNAAVIELEDDEVVVFDLSQIAYVEV